MKSILNWMKLGSETQAQQRPSAQRLLARASTRNVLAVTVLAAPLALAHGCGGSGVPEDSSGFDTLPASASSAVTLEDSSIRFTISKWGDVEGKSRIPVTGTFDSFEVELSENLAERQTLEDLSDVAGTVRVHLESLNTALEIRDQNITRTFFELPSFASSATFSFSNVRPQGTGASGEVLADATLSLHGVQQELKDITLFVARREGEWEVRTAESLMIRSADFALSTQALLATCGHLGIDEAAQVDVVLHILDRDGE